MKIHVPTDLNDITVSQYQRFMAANTEDADQDFLLFKTIEIFCDVDIKLVSQFPLADAQDIAAEIHAVLDQHKPFQSSFELNGIEYGFLPDLENISIGEYIDLESGLSDVKDLHKAAAVMFRPIRKRKGELYAVVDYKGSNAEGNDAKSFPMGAVSAGIVFFYNIANELLAGFRRYSKNKQAMIDQQIIRDSLNSLRSGGGINQSTR